LRPFGHFDDLDKLYRSDPYTDWIKSQYVKVDDTHIVGDSQYGLYFRLVEKTNFDGLTIYKTDNEQFEDTRSFIFDFGKFLEYVDSYTKSVPLFFYNSGNEYGRESLSKSTLHHNGIQSFLDDINNSVQGDFLHELICRIPIPLNQETGFVGKINRSTLKMMNTLQKEQQMEEYERERDEYQEQYIRESYLMDNNPKLYDEINRCKSFEEYNCAENKCWYNNGECKPTYSFVTKSII